MTDELKRVLEFTDEELNAQYEVGDYVKEKMFKTMHELDHLVTDEMVEKGMDLRLTIELLPR